jgi:hypothetical protein
MTADTHTAPATPVLRQRLVDRISRWTATGVRRNAAAPRHTPLTSRRRRPFADPTVPVPHVWSIDQEELRSALEDSGF